MWKGDLEINVTLCLHNSFYRDGTTVPCCKQRVQEQRCWRTASNSFRIATDLLQDTETESAESMPQEEEMEQWQKIREEQDAKRERLDELRSIRTSKRQKTRRKSEVTVKKKMIKLTIVLVREKFNGATKQLSLLLKLNERKLYLLFEVKNVLPS